MIARGWKPLSGSSVFSRRTVTSCSALVVQHGAPAEPAAVDHLQQRGERLRVAVVRGRGQEQPVLTSLGQLPRRDRALAVHGVAAAADRRAVGLAGATWCASSTTSTSNANRRALLSCPTWPYTSRSSRWARSVGSHAIVTITRGNSRNGLAFRPWLRRTCGHQLAVDDHEVEAELLAHLVLPLQRQARRADDDHRAGPVPQQQLLDDQPGLDGLAEADVVGQQQVRPRGLQGPAQRLELVGLDVRAAAERRLVGVRRRPR